MHISIQLNHFTSRIATEAMKVKFGSFSWQPSGVFCTPTLVKCLPIPPPGPRPRRGNFGGRGGALRGNFVGRASTDRALLHNLAREETQEKEEEGMSDISVDLGIFE